MEVLLRMITAAIVIAAYFAAGRILQATDTGTPGYPIWMYLLPGVVSGVIVGRWWTLLLPIVWLPLAQFAGPSPEDNGNGIVLWSILLLAPVEAAAIGFGIGLRRVLTWLLSRPGRARSPKLPLP